MAKRPPQDGFVQKKVGSAKPGGFSNTPVEVTFTLAFEQNGRSIDFIFIENIPAGGTASGVIREAVDASGAGTGEYYLAVTNDTILTIALASNLDWRWAQNQTAVTTKADNSSRYAVIGGFDDPIGNSITLHCKARGGNVPKTDSFSLSVDLKQSRGSFLPITIDPDIRNPPPGENMVPAIGPGGGTLKVMLSADF
jgi:hypothetical protein